MGKRRKKKSVRLSRERWSEAALDALVRDGLGAVAVEPLAAALGVTKGSFYWHFASRDELVTAAAERWEAIAAENVIAAVETETSPIDRLHKLLDYLPQNLDLLRMEAAIGRATTHPAVAEVVCRVAERRLAFLVMLYRELGHSPAVAKRWGAAAYATYVGTVHMLDAHPELFPTKRTLKAYVEHVGTLLVPAAGRGSTP